jgi:hypothetical protein
MMEYANLNNENDVLCFIKYLLDDSIINRFIQTKIIENELIIVCDDGTKYKLSIRS